MSIWISHLILVRFQRWAFNWKLKNTLTSSLFISAFFSLLLRQTMTQQRFSLIHPSWKSNFHQKAEGGKSNERKWSLLKCFFLFCLFILFVLAVYILFMPTDWMFFLFPSNSHSFPMKMTPQWITHHHHSSKQERQQEKKNKKKGLGWESTSALTHAQFYEATCRE